MAQQGVPSSAIITGVLEKTGLPVRAVFVPDPQPARMIEIRGTQEKSSGWACDMGGISLGGARAAANLSQYGLS
jgi:hypothetical protein